MTAADILTKLRRAELAVDAATAPIDAQLEALHAPIRAALAEMEAEIQPQVEALNDERQKAIEDVIAKTGFASLAQMEEQARKAVLQQGRTAKSETLGGISIECRWVRGSISWDDKMLTGYATVHPEILSFRKGGLPKTAIYRVKENDK